MEIPKPLAFDELFKCATILSKSFIYVRVDFYVLNDNSLKFGEMSFYPASGISEWNPKKYNKIFGDKIILPLEKIKP
jgi:hypothetical protein